MQIILGYNIDYFVVALLCLPSLPRKVIQKRHTFYIFEVCQPVWPKLHEIVELQSRLFAYVTLGICRTNIYLYKFLKNLNFDTDCYTDFYHNAIITTTTVSTFNNNNRISILECAYCESEKFCIAYHVLFFKTSLCIKYQLHA